MSIYRYFENVETSKVILWCYLLWYLTIASFHFDSGLNLWLSSLGLSMIVGLALMLAVGPITWDRLTTRFWESLRLVLCPFLVSSFSSLVKGKGFVLILSPVLFENLAALSVCATFVVCVVYIKKSRIKVGGDCKG